MHTNFTPVQLTNPDIASLNVELSACLQCGYCIDNCPTYQMFDEEYDSPRGRIYLINEMLEKADAPDGKTVNHIDRCLSCLACMSTCPSSVHYMHLVDHGRKFIEENYMKILWLELARSSNGDSWCNYYYTLVIWFVEANHMTSPDRWKY
jgi:glycolate oxidase iron-sulfur subunit